MLAVGAVMLCVGACGPVTPTDSFLLTSADENVGATEDGLSGSVAVGSDLTTTAAVNFRTGPSTGHKVLRVLAKGTTVVAVQSSPSNGFYKVKHSGTVGWVHGAYLQKKGASGSSYRLPWTCGKAFKCSSGNHTSNHSGMDAYAYDFAMPSGTTLRAMRSGTVLRVRKVSSPGSACYHGGGSSCANKANTVEIKHSDGTVALYMHLSTIAVSTGQHVSRGAVIGTSGNSGWSTGPHLHVQVQKNCGSWWCQSIPFKFEESGNVKTGTTPTSKNCQ
jgi:murein DD-endopeptidase MepM/ murein hydrolase activator NlpD